MTTIRSIFNLQLDKAISTDNVFQHRKKVISLFLKDNKINFVLDGQYGRMSLSMRENDTKIKGFFTSSSLQKSISDMRVDVKKFLDIFLPEGEIISEKISSCSVSETIAEEHKGRKWSIKEHEDFHVNSCGRFTTLSSKNISARLYSNKIVVTFKIEKNFEEDFVVMQSLISLV